MMSIMQPRTLPLLLSLAFAAVPSSAEPVRLSAAAFGTEAEIEIRDLPREQATAAARDALEEIFEVSRLFDPSGDVPGGIGTLNAAAGGEPLVLEARVAEVLRRGLQYCLWTNGAHGPLGGEIYRLWNGYSTERPPGGGPTEHLPETTKLRDAVIGAACNRMALTFGETDVSAQVAAGSQVAAIGMGRGFAIDRAAELLRAAGVENAWLEIGGVWRAMGLGPEGRGWLASLPPAPGEVRPSEQVWLRDQSLAIATREPSGGQPALRFIDQRTGMPPRGVILVAAVTEEAVDAEALAATLYVTGLREGHLRLGALKPRPFVYWLLGQGQSEPLQSTYRWSDLERVRHRN